MGTTMKRIAIIGLGLFGRRLARLLAEAGADVIAIDRQQELIEQIRDQVSLAICMDCTDEQALRANGIDQVDVAVVGVGNSFEDAALIVTLLDQIGVPRIISRATSHTRREILRRIGAKEIVDPEREAAERWRNRLMLPTILEHITLGDGFSLVQVAVPASFVGKTLGDLDIRKKHQVNVVGIRRGVSDEATGESKDVLINVPMADTLVMAGDILLLIGDDNAIGDFPTK
jgi:trk system potassium uptake protein